MHTYSLKTKVILDLANIMSPKEYPAKIRQVAFYSQLHIFMQ